MALIFERYAPEWPSSAVGVLGNLWRQDARPSAEKLIDLARTLFDISGAITPESASVFGRKIRQLLYCKDDHQYEELMAELRVGALFAARAGPVAWEPLARLANDDASPRTQPKSPDYAIRLPSSDVAIEVTTIRIGALDNWERAIEVVVEKLRAATRQAAMRKEIEIHAPLRMRADALTRNIVDQLIKEMKASPSGSKDIQLGPPIVRISWRDIPIVSLPPGSSPADLSVGDAFPSGEHFSALVASSGSGFPFQSALASKVVPILGHNVEELFVNSIRNKLDLKRAQLQVEVPSLLILQPGAWRIPPDYVQHLVDKRIWPNPQYSWLTGIGILLPRRTFNLRDPPARLIVSWNTQPKIPRTTALNDLVEQNAYFSKGLPIDPPKSDGDLSGAPASSQPN
jgi:hypothetical protein